MFDTPAEYASHLSELIDDADLIAMAVRRKFPETRGPAVKMSAARFKEEGSKKPTTQHDAWMCSDMQDRDAKQNMVAGSKKLLAALWHQHPRALRTLTKGEMPC